MQAHTQIKSLNKIDHLNSLLKDNISDNQKPQSIQEQNLKIFSANVSSSSPYKIGPQTYYPNKEKFLLKVPVCIIGKQEKMQSPSHINAPGPNKYTPNYDLQLQKEPIIKIGKAERFSRQRLENIVPGPNRYNVKYNQDSQFGIHKIPCLLFPRAQRITDSMNSNPGPQSYSPNNSFYNRSPRMVFGKSLKENNSLSMKTPGVGQYNIDPQKYFQKGVSIRFSSASRSEKLSNADNPGPGAYQVEVKFGQLPKYLEMRNTIRSSSSSRSERRKNKFV